MDLAASLLGLLTGLGKYSEVRTSMHPSSPQSNSTTVIFCPGPVRPQLQRHSKEVINQHRAKGQARGPVTP
jgi:hypothetical protein